MAVSALWVGAQRRCYVTFNMTLQVVALDPTNWRLTYSGGSKSPVSASFSASGEVITLQFDASPGVSAIAYEPPPFDVVAVLPNGLVAQAFTLPL